MPRRTATDTTAAQPVTLNINTTTPVAPPEPEKSETREEKPPHWFFTQIAELPAHEWGRIYSLELYRLKPDVPGVPGTKGYLRLFNEPITLETLRTTVGGGRFRLNLCKNSRWHTSHEFEIEGAPIYDSSRERPSTNGNGAPANGADFQREFISVLREELQRSRESNQGVPAGTDQVVQMLTSASEKAMEIVTKQAPPKDASAELNNLLAAAKTIAELRAPASSTSSFDKLLEALLPKLIEKLTTPVDPLAELTKLGALFDVLEKLRGGAGAAGGEPKDWKAALVSYMPQILDAFKQNNDATTAAAQARANEAAARARAAENLRAIPAMPAAIPSAPAPASAPAFTVPPAGAPAHTPISVAGFDVVSRDAAPAAAPGPAAQAPLEISQEEFDQILKVNVVNMFRSGASGGSIASYIEDLKPEFAKDFVRYTTQQITLFFQGDPVLKLMVEDPRWNEVLEDARDFMKEENADLVPSAV